MGNKIQFVSLLILGVTLCGSVMAEQRNPAVAGQFYPADSSELHQLVATQLAAADQTPKIDGRIIAILVPHAGLVYSGPIAAYAYRLLENSGVNKVILCGPSHRYAFQGLSVYGPGVQWRTPLGVVPCDDQLCKTLVDEGQGISVLPQAQSQEHSLEVQLPFLQTVLEKFAIVPVVMGYQDNATINRLANALKQLPLDDHTVMIASSDLQHYRPADKGRPMDSLGIKCVTDLDPGRLEKYLADGTTEMCGGGPAGAVRKAAMAKGANRAKLVKYGDSGDASGDKSQVVGYAAVVLYLSSVSPDTVNTQRKETTAVRDQNEQTEVSHLTESEKTRLLLIARQSIDSYLKTGKLPEFDATGVLAEPGAAFVTLKKKDQLRGCIGQTAAAMPLYKTVATCAVHSALDDPRFPAVTEDEVPGLEIEISVLTPLEPVPSLDSIVVGRDGLMITKGNYHGLLLPQVASEYGWNRTEFLEYTCQKAGLPKQAYKDPGATIYRFQAIVFGEH